LTGSRRRGEKESTTRARTDEYAQTLYTDADFDVVDRVVELARGRGLPPAQIALAWLLRQPGVTPIVGASKMEHLEQAVEALSVMLSDEECRALEEPYRPHPVRGHH
ncbi:MAG TPA: aldo/keto reductase, partial [Thermoanaerobaculia bacterium]|nr:aldo/keto reductase [Thermoanaerobaculia bacterium]